MAETRHHISSSKTQNDNNKDNKSSKQNMSEARIQSHQCKINLKNVHRLASWF